MDLITIICSVCGVLFAAYGLNKIVGARGDGGLVLGLQYIIFSFPYWVILYLHLGGFND